MTVPLDLSTLADLQITKRLVGKTFATNGTLRTNNKWNVDRWCADVDLTCHALIRSLIAPGVVATKRHIIQATHFANDTPVPVNYDFLTNDNVVISRQVVRRDENLDTDLTIGLLDSDLPDTITPTQILPLDYRNYIVGLSIFDSPHVNGPLIFSTDQEDKALVAEWVSINPPEKKSVTFSPTRDSHALTFWEELIDGDSGSPFFLFITVNNVITPVLITQSLFSGLGPELGVYAATLNAQIAAVDTAHGISTGYTVTEADFDDYRIVGETLSVPLITTASEYLEPLGYDDLNTAEQARITSLIDSATTIIEKYCNRTFAETTYVEEKNGPGEDYILANNIPITSLTSIVFIDEADGTEETIVATSNFLVKETTGEIRWAVFSTSSSKYNGFFPEGFQNIKLNYTGGFNPVPEPIQQACAELVMYVVDPDLLSGMVEKEKLGQHFIGFSDKAKMSALAQASSILAMYKRRSR